MFLPFDKEERESLLRQYWNAVKEYDTLMESSSLHPPWSEEEKKCLARAGKYFLEIENLETRYFERIPHRVMSCCPFDGKALVRSFDPYGLDGLWWRSDATPAEIPSCTHFSVLAGAVNYSGNAPEAGGFEAHPGPEVPYVIPRLLGYPGMIAVISEIRMDCGYIAYPVAYFSEKRPLPQELTAGWARTNFVYTTQLGGSGWRIPDDPWDFDLLPWIRAGKVRWCPQGADNTVLSTDAADRCPYVNIPGERQRIVVERNRFWKNGLPGGDPVGLIG